MGYTVELKLKKGVVALALLAGAFLLMGASPGGEARALSSPASFPSKVEWTPDGKHIIFSRGFHGIFMVDVAGSKLQAIPRNAPMGTPSSPGYALPALSPDGTQLAYVARLRGLDQTATIMVSALDGTGARRLTQDEKLNTHPAWSPDGKEIAYIADSKLTIMHADGTNERLLAPSVEAASAAPEWSPDGSRIAFVGIQNDAEHPNAVYTVRPDGTGLTNLGATVSVPSWSPNSRRIAFFIPEDRGVSTLYALDSRGNDRQPLLSRNLGGTWVGNLSWTPDGSTLLFSPPRGVVMFVGVRGAVGELPLLTPGAWAEWSPNGKRIAVLTSLSRSDHTDSADQEVLYTMMRDGRFKRDLVIGSEERLVPKYPGWYNVSRNIAACGQGYVVSDPVAQGFLVPNPYGNTGLVQDCETLMKIRDRLAGDFLLNWWGDTPIREWWGVLPVNWTDHDDRVGGLWFAYPLFSDEPIQFHKFYFALLDYLNHHLNPSVEGRQSNSKTPVGYKVLSGSIPSDLVNLTALQFLNLSGNGLTGRIPPELGGFANLRVLDLGDSALSGSIPRQLGKLTGLSVLDLKGNNFSGCVPRAFHSSSTSVSTDGLEYCTE